MVQVEPVLEFLPVVDLAIRNPRHLLMGHGLHAFGSQAIDGEPGKSQGGMGKV